MSKVTVNVPTPVEPTVTVEMTLDEAGAVAALLGRTCSSSQEGGVYTFDLFNELDDAVEKHGQSHYSVEIDGSSFTIVKHSQ